LISAPLRGAQEHGAIGFIGGAVSGISGVVINPLTGIIDATQVTAEGLRGSANRGLG